MGVKSSKIINPSSRPSACSCVNLRRAARAITKIYDKILEPSNLKTTQYSALVNIILYGPLNISKLAVILTLDRTTLVRNLKSLESCGFIESTSTEDTRERAVSITESGRAVVESAKPYWRTAQGLIEEQLGQDSMKQLGSLVTILEGISVAEINDGVESSA